MHLQSSIKLFKTLLVISDLEMDIVTVSSNHEMSREWENKHTCPLYIDFCSGLGRQHTKGTYGSRYQSICEPIEPSQTVMSDGEDSNRVKWR